MEPTRKLRFLAPVERRGRDCIWWFRRERRYSLTRGSVLFSATGGESVRLNCTSTGEQAQSCKALSSPLLVKGSLLLPISVTPAYSEGPPGHDKAGCTAAAQNPTWILSTASYIDQMVDGTEESASRTFSVLVTNPSIGYQASCFSSGALACVGNEFGSLGADRYRISTSAYFDATMHRFTVNQTWYCDDVDAGKP